MTSLVDFLLVKGLSSFITYGLYDGNSPMTPTSFPSAATSVYSPLKLDAGLDANLTTQKRILVG